MCGSEMARVMEMIHIIMDLASRARYLQRPVHGAEQILIDAAKQGGNFCCFLGLEAEIEQEAGRFLLPLYSELDHNPDNTALRAATYCLHGDVLKIAAAIDPTKYPMSQSLLQRSRDASQGLPRWSTGYPNTRSLAIVAGHINLSDAGFGKIADLVEGDIEAGHIVPFKSVHSRDGLVEMHAARFKALTNPRDAREALRHWDLYKKEWKHAEETSGSHDEFRLRGEILKTKLADANIFEHLGCDKGNAPLLLEGINTDVLRRANGSGSPRVAAQAEKGIQKWRR